MRTIMSERTRNHRNAQASPSSSVLLGLICSFCASGHKIQLCSMRQPFALHRSRMMLRRVIREAFRTLVRQL